MPLPDESSRPSASSLIARFEAINASQESTSTPMNQSASGSSTGARRAWFHPSSPPAQTLAPPTTSPPPAEALTKAGVATENEPRADKAGQDATSPPAHADEPLPQSRIQMTPPKPLLFSENEATTVLFPGSSSSPTNSSHRLPPIITQPSLDVPAPEPVPGSADSLLAASSLHDLFAGERSQHSKSPSIDSNSSRVSHEGLSQPASPRIDEKRLSAPPVRGEASPPPSDAGSPPKETVFTFPSVVAHDALEEESRLVKTVPEPPTEPALPSPTNTIKSLTARAPRTKPSSPPLRRSASPTIPKPRSSLTSPTASSLAKARARVSSDASSPSSSPKASPKNSTMRARPPSAAASRGGVSPTPSTASRSSALSARAPATPTKMTSSGTKRSSGTTRSRAASTASTTSSANDGNATSPVRAKSRSTTSPLALSTNKPSARIGNIKMASRGRIGLAGARPSTRPQVKNEVEEKREGEQPSAPPPDEEIPDIPTDDEHVFDAKALQGGRPAPGRIGIPIDEETGRAVGADEVEAA